MPVIFRLAVRNLKEHKSKTIIIALFLIFGTAIVIMGNSFLESINRGLERDFRANYTGDIALSVKPQKGWRLDIFGMDSNSISTDIPQIPALPDLDGIMEVVNRHSSDISSHTKLISAQVFVAEGIEVDFSELFDDDNLTFDDMPISMLFAGEDESYWKTFSGINFTEGTFPSPNTNEIIIDTRVQRAFQGLYKKDLKIGDTVLLAGANTNGVIREAKVVGIFKPANEYSAMFQIIYCNPSLARSFADLTYASLAENDLPDNIDLSLSELSEDELFGSFDDDFAFDEIEDDSAILGSTTDFDDILGDTSLRDELNKTDDGAWQFVLMKVKNPLATNRVLKELKADLESAGYDLQVMDWRLAAASYAYTVEGIGVVFNILVIILAVVVFIIIMNTMTVSVIERTGEIGTMRAIGAEKKFVKKLFYTEAVSLTFFSAIIGIIFAFICMGIFNSLGITITNSIAKMILGGGLLHFTPTVGIILATFVIAILGSVVSNFYPVSSALKVTPLKALSKGSD
ncbi:MAG: ABC transporter permease [Treponema sp.]|nr:ABC transporter permease [Treponema sp.]